MQNSDGKLNEIVSKNFSYFCFHLIDSYIIELKPRPHETKSDTHIPSSTNGAVVSTPTLSPTRHHLLPNTANVVNNRNILQRSPSSTTPSTSNTHVAAFRSQRGSVSFDTQAPLINAATAATAAVKGKPPTTHSILPTCIAKPRLKFSMVRDTAMASLGHSAPVYSMPITRDYSIDEKTNRIVNEFLMHDPSLDGTKKGNNDDLSYRGTPKRHHHHRTRQKTFEDIMSTNNTQKQSQQQPSPPSPQQQPRSPVNKRHHSSTQANVRKYSYNQYPSVHSIDDNQQNEEEDSSDPASPPLKLNHSPIVAMRRDNVMAIESPSIIITRDDSGSQ